MDKNGPPDLTAPANSPAWEAENRAFDAYQRRIASDPESKSYQDGQSVMRAHLEARYVQWAADTHSPTRNERLAAARFFVAQAGQFLDKGWVPVPSLALPKLEPVAYVEGMRAGATKWGAAKTESIKLREQQLEKTQINLPVHGIKKGRSL